MKALILAGLLLTAAPALADEIEYQNGEVFINLENGQGEVICELVGTTGRTSSDPEWQRIHDALIDHYQPRPRRMVLPKPAHGYCMNAFNIQQRVPYKRGWPINLGEFGNIIGIQCSVDSDDDGVTCDWPPYGTKAGPVKHDSFRELTDPDLS